MLRGGLDNQQADEFARQDYLNASEAVPKDKNVKTICQILFDLALASDCQRIFFEVRLNLFLRCELLSNAAIEIAKNTHEIKRKGHSHRQRVTLSLAEIFGVSSRKFLMSKFEKRDCGISRRYAFADNAFTR
jgi:hypothetical protein